MSVLVSILVKTYNEAANIERCLRSCIDALEGIEGEVIVADCLSEDATVAIAARLPVRIVQLVNAADRGCGIAAQLGYQHATGKYVHIIDGDMELPKAFLREAISVLDLHPEVAGVSGQLQELHPDSLLSRARASRAKRRHEMSGEVDRLNGGGLYRRQANEEAGGYLTHPGLHAHEELELALRLRTAGWKLVKLDTISMRHAAHVDPPFKLLARRWRSGYALGAGEFVRAAIGRPYLARVLREFSFHFGMWGYWALLLAGLVAAMVAPGMGWLFAALLLLPVAVMILRKRSVALGVYAFASWNVFAAGMAWGLLGRAGGDPRRRIASRVIQDGCPAARRRTACADEARLISEAPLRRATR